jgi:chromosome segregation ATPase
MNSPNNIKNNEEMNMNPKNINLKHMKLNQGFDAGYVQEDKGFINQDINNENIINNNNNEIMNQKLMEHINEINQRFYELEKEFKFMEKQNKELKMKLKYEQLKNKELKPSDIKIYENSINQGKIFLEDIKKKNTVLKKKISELEEQKNTLDYKLIEANQKIKRYERDYNINDNKKEENKNNNDKEQNNEILSLKNKIDEYEIANSKLTLDNNNLKKKIENMEEEHNKQIKLITDYKNSELTSFQKVISQYKEYFKNHNINPNVNTPLKNEKNSINANNNNSTIDYEKIMLEMTNKDKLIK